MPTAATPTACATPTGSSPTSSPTSPIPRPARWQERGSGIWEARAGPQHYLSGKLYCWVAVDRAIRLAPRLAAEDRVERWSRERERVREAILTRGWSASKRAFAQAFDSDDLDAAALLVKLVGFLPADDERVISTIEAIERELVEDGLVLRYRSDDGLAERRAPSSSAPSGS